jgi:hypothetical protein
MTPVCNKAAQGNIENKNFLLPQICSNAEPKEYNANILKKICIKPPCMNMCVIGYN